MIKSLFIFLGIMFVVLIVGIIAAMGWRQAGNFFLIVAIAIALLCLMGWLQDRY